MSISKDLMFDLMEAEEALEAAQDYGDEAQVAAAIVAFDLARERQAQWNDRLGRLIRETDERVAKAQDDPSGE